MKRTLLCILLCSYFLLGYSQKDTPDIKVDEAELMDEDSAIQSKPDPAFTQAVTRHVSDDSIQALKQQEAFAYMQYIDSFFRNRKYPKEKIIKEDEPVEKPGLFANPGLRMLYWLLAFGVVIWIIWRMFIGKRSLFTRNKHIDPEENEDDHVITEDMGSEQLIDKAINEKNYRMAIRYMYLQTLAILAEKEMIALAPQKTNYQYIQELNSKTDKETFSKLTLRYEYAWYGGFSVASSQFENIYQEFNQYKNTLASL